MDFCAKCRHWKGQTAVLDKKLSRRCQRGGGNFVAGTNFACTSFKEKFESPGFKEFYQAVADATYDRRWALANCEAGITCNLTVSEMAEAHLLDLNPAQFAEIRNDLEALRELG